MSEVVAARPKITAQLSTLELVKGAPDAEALCRREELRAIGHQSCVAVHF